MKKYRLDLASGPVAVTENSHLVDAYLASEVDAILTAILRELEDDDLNVAKIMVRNALNGSASD